MQHIEKMKMLGQRFLALSSVTSIYRNHFEIWFLSCVKAPRFDDRKRVNINNMDPFAIDQTPGL
jgi:hypothetical protein